MTTLAAFAQAEYTRRHEQAVIAVANRRLNRDRAERTCAAWLSIVLRLGGTHPHAARLLSEEADGAPSWPARLHIICAADRLAPLAVCHRALDHARAQATTHDRGDAAQIARAQSLRAMCAALEVPFTVTPAQAGAQLQRKAA
jgi:hypothetical protein